MYHLDHLDHLELGRPLPTALRWPVSVSLLSHSPTDIRGRYLLSSPCRSSGNEHRAFLIVGCNPPRELPMSIHVTTGPVVSLIAGILILVIPRLLNYIVAIYLIVIGLLGLGILGGV